VDAFLFVIFELICDISGNPFGPFWDGLKVDFDRSIVYDLTYDERDLPYWSLRYVNFEPIDVKTLKNQWKLSVQQFVLLFLGTYFHFVLVQW
jgi:hypothetical protein